MRRPMFLTVVLLYFAVHLFCWSGRYFICSRFRGVSLRGISHDAVREAYF